MEEDLGREPAQMQEDTAETIKEMKEELAEERAEQSQERQSLNLIGLSTAIFSTLAAIAAMQGGYFANEGMLAQIKSSNSWSQFQAKSTKRHIEESNVTILQALQKPVPTKTTSEIEKLNKEQQEIQKEARQLQAESQQDLQRHELFARSVAALQVGISMGAIAALTRRQIIWYAGLGISALGIGFAISGTLPSQEKAIVVNSPKAELIQTH
jgi:NADH dehydrogenase/NADH:ubiquinone oxidoreductase subunit G